MSEEMEYRYDAFISYRHKELDIAVAREIHKQLETYRIPAYIRKKTGKRKMGKVFRDQDELPLLADLGEGIRRALEQSRWLIVVCSPDLPLSKWCLAEIDYFIELGRRERILTVLIAGEPEESFPRQLRFWDGEEREPLAADVRAETLQKSVKKVKREKLRLLAPMLGVGYDDLRRRQRERFLRTMTAASAAVMVATLGAGAYVLRQNALLQNQIALTEEQKRIVQEQRDDALAERSRSLAATALDQLEYGDISGTALLALEALPADLEQPDIPLVPEAKTALISAALFDSMGTYQPVAALGHAEGIAKYSNVAVSPNGKQVLVYGDTNLQICYLYNLEDLSVAARVIGGVGSTSIYCDEYQNSEGEARSVSLQIRSPRFNEDGSKLLVPAGLTPVLETEAGEVLSTGDLSAEALAEFGLAPRTARQMDGGVLALADLTTGRVLSEIAPEGNLRYSCFTPDGQHFLRLSDDALTIYDAATGQALAVTPRTWPQGIQQSHTFLSRDGKVFVYATSKKNADTGVEQHHLEVIAVPTGAIIGSYTTQNTGTHTLSNGGNLFSNDRALNLYSPASGKLLLHLDAKRIDVLDTVTGEICATLEAYGSGIPYASFDETGERIITSSTYASTGHLEVWDASTGELLDKVTLGDYSFRTAFLVEGGNRIVASAYDVKGYRSFVQVWEKGEHPYSKAIDNEHSTAVYYADGTNRFAIGCGNVGPSVKRDIIVYDDNRDELFRFEDSQNTSHMALSPDSSLLAADDDAAVSIWDASTGRKLQTFTVENNPQAFQFSPDNKRLLVEYSLYGIATQGFYLIDLESGVPLSQGFFGPEGVLFADPELTRVVYIYSNTLSVWDLAAGEELFSLSDFPRAEAQLGSYGGLKAAISPDGRILAVSHARTRALQLHDATTGALLRELSLDNRPASSLTYSPDGSRLLVFSAIGNMVRMYDTADYTVLYSNMGRYATANPIFSADGRRVFFSYSAMDAESGEIIFHIRQKSNQIQGCSPDGSRLLVSYFDSGHRHRLIKIPELPQLFRESSALTRNRIFGEEEQLRYHLES